MSERRKGRLTLLLILFFFLLPVLIGLYLYASGRHLGGRSHGELLQPPRKLASVPSLDWQGKWHLVYVSGGTCAAECRDVLHMMRQMHVSLAKDIDRLQRVWLVDGVLADEVQRELQQQYPDLQVRNGAAGMARNFDVADEPAGTGGRLYLVDPLGNLMMSYPRGADPYAIRKDVVRLLRYSWTG